MNIIRKIRNRKLQRKRDKFLLEAATKQRPCDCKSKEIYERHTNVVDEILAIDNEIALEELPLSRVTKKTADKIKDMVVRDINEQIKLEEARFLAASCSMWNGQGKHLIDKNKRNTL